MKKEEDVSVNVRGQDIGQRTESISGDWLKLRVERANVPNSMRGYVAIYAEIASILNVIISFFCH